MGKKTILREDVFYHMWLKTRRIILVTEDGETYTFNREKFYDYLTPFLRKMFKEIEEVLRCEGE